MATVSLRGTEPRSNGGSHANPNYTYDLIVIGGGSGGLAAAKEAAKHGAKVALFDYVKPSTQGSKWGLGGTCVNVGCVPKKICHYSGLLGHAIKDAQALGWTFGDPKPAHDWEGLSSPVRDHRGMLNFLYRRGLQSAHVEYINALTAFTGPHSVTYLPKGKEEGEEVEVSAAHIVIAVGGRPVVPREVPGAVEYAVTSDDLFTLKTPPGKTLCVGGSYIALECAGFLTELGNEVHVAVRSILLRGFDRQCAEKIGAVMQEFGTEFLYQTMPTHIAKTEDGRLKVSFRHTGTQAEHSDIYDTVVYAIGRNPDTAGLNLKAAGVALNGGGKFVTDKEERTNVPHIYAVGDVLEGKPELTPVAIRTGELLARRLFAGSKKLMDYDLVPTTVFTPTEYGCCGLSEEDAVDRYGEANVEVFLSEFMTLEFAATHRQRAPKRMGEDGMNELQPMCLAKLVCLKQEDNKVVGFHFVGPNAGEITQGFHLAMKLGAKKADFDDMIGIHPTDAEAFASLHTTKASGESWLNVGCGGGKCG
uniref:Thioredoxin reductase n=2 Tax=Nannochloropsis gaditana TaxID=72520 RepID=I2CP09_NANGC